MKFVAVVADLGEWRGVVAGGGGRWQSAPGGGSLIRQAPGSGRACRVVAEWLDVRRRTVADWLSARCRAVAELLRKRAEHRGPTFELDFFFKLPRTGANACKPPLSLADVVEVAPVLCSRS